MCGKRFHRLALAAGGIGEVIDQQGAGDLHLDRPRKRPVRQAVAGAGRQREGGIIAARSGLENIHGAEVGLIAREIGRVGRAVLPGLEPGRCVERQQHRNRTAADAVENLRGDGVELHQRRHRARVRRRHPLLDGEAEGGGGRRPAAYFGAKLVERGAPFDAHRRDRGGMEFVGDDAAVAGQKQQESC